MAKVKGEGESQSGEKLASQEENVIGGVGRFFDLFKKAFPEASEEVIKKFNERITSIQEIEDGAGNLWPEGFSLELRQLHSHGVSLFIVFEDKETELSVSTHTKEKRGVMRLSPTSFDKVELKSQPGIPLGSGHDSIVFSSSTSNKVLWLHEDERFSYFEDGDNEYISLKLTK